MRDDEYITHSRPTVSSKDIHSLVHQLESLNLASGDLVPVFQDKIAHLHGYGSAKCVSSGSSALTHLLMEMGVGEGDEVIVSRYVCKSVATAILATGARPRFHEVTTEWRPDPDSIKTLLNERTRAIVLVHIFGIDASFPDLHDIDVPIIDDLCQAFGLRPAHGKRDAAFFSFNATKCLTTGEGGAFCLSPDLRQRLQWIQGDRMSDLQARLGLSQLGQYPDYLGRRAEIANQYLNHLPSSLVKNTLLLRDRSLWFRFPVRLRVDFTKIQSFMEKENIAIRRGVDTLLRSDDGSDVVGEVSQEVFDSTVSLPIYPAMNDVHVNRVVRALREGLEI